MKPWYDPFIQGLIKMNKYSFNESLTDKKFLIGRIVKVITFDRKANSINIKNAKIEDINED